MTIETLESDLIHLTENLLEMARNCTKNEISNDCKYLLTEIVNSEMNLNEQRKRNKKLNDLKNPRNLNQIIPDLKVIYDNIYDLNVYVFKAESNITIIEIKYFLKSSLNKNDFEKVKNSEPMFHCKLAIPPYVTDNNMKFDINWEHGGLRHIWNMFWWRKKIAKNENKQTTFID